MSTELIINASLPETRIALLEDGRIQELHIERASDRGIVGNIYKGKVTRVLPGMQAAFVDIGEEKAAFLYVDDVHIHKMFRPEEETKTPEHSVSLRPRKDPSEQTEKTGDDENQAAGEFDPDDENSTEADDMDFSDADEDTDGDINEDADTDIDGDRSDNGDELALDVDHRPEDSDGLGFDGLPKDTSAERDLYQDSDQNTDAEVVAHKSIFDDEDDNDSFGSNGSDPYQDEDDASSDDKFDSFSDNTDSDQEDLSDAEAVSANTNADADDDDRGPQPVGMGPEPDASHRVLSTVAPSEPEPLKIEKPKEAEDSAHESINEEKSNSENEQRIEDTDSKERTGTEKNDLDNNYRGGRDNYRGGGHGGYRSRGNYRGGYRDRPQRGGGRYYNNRDRAPYNDNGSYPDSYYQNKNADGDLEADRSSLTSKEDGVPEGNKTLQEIRARRSSVYENASRGQAFRQKRNRDKRIRSRTMYVPPKINIQDILKEGQDVLVQVAKDPISNKGARLTCHISLPGRHLVCMPTINHIGVSRRIERDEERRRLRDYVEKHRRKDMGFIVRTAGGVQTDQRIIEDMDYLSRLWEDITKKTMATPSPAMIYEDLNAVLRSIRDWVTEGVDRIIVDSKDYYEEVKDFSLRFMPSIENKVDLYQGDLPIFDAYKISTDLHRALERRVWLKSGGYIVIDQAEALVAIDVNTGRFVGKKNLEDTILKTNLEAVEEIAYQLRLRNCGGIIIIDLIDMEKEESKYRVYRALEDATKADRARPVIQKISELGLVEMTRKRTRDTIIRALCESCSYCEGKGYLKSKDTVAYEVLREVEREMLDRDVKKILVQAHPNVIDILAMQLRHVLDRFEDKYRKYILLQSVMDYHQEQFEVSSENHPRVTGIRPSYQRTRPRPQYVPPRAPEHVVTQRSEIEKREVTAASTQSFKSNSEESNQGSQNQDVPNQDVQNQDAVGADGVRSEHNDTGSDFNPADFSRSGYGSDQNDETNAQAFQNRNAQNYTNSNDAGENNNSSVSTPDKKDEDDGFFDDEDRKAFLKAQAAQDAALANLESARSNTGVPTRPSSYRSQGRSGSGGRNNAGGGMRRGRSNGPGNNQRGGKRRYNNSHRPDRRPYRNQVRMNADVKNNDPGLESASATENKNGSGSGGGSGGNGDDGGRSQPPID